jgi:hypothetical protein
VLPDREVPKVLRVSKVMQVSVGLLDRKGLREIKGTWGQ